MSFNSWSKNALLSLKYAGVNYLKRKFENTDKIISSLKDSKDLFNETKQNLARDFQDKVWDKTIRTGYKNILVAGKTGKFVPSQQEMEKSMAKAMGFDFDMGMDDGGFDLDTSDLNFDEESTEENPDFEVNDEGEEGTSDEGNTLENNQTTLNIFKADNDKLGKAIIKTSSALNQSINQSLAFQTKSSIIASSKILEEIGKQTENFANVYRASVSINDNVVNMANELRGHHDLMEELTMATKDAVVQLQEINKGMQVNLSVYGKTLSGDDLDIEDDEDKKIFDSDGNFNPKAYIKKVGRKLRDEMDIDMFSSMVENLSSFAVDMITDAASDKLNLTKPIERLDKLLGNVPNLLFGKLEEFADRMEGKNGVLDFILDKTLDIFGRRQYARSEEDVLQSQNQAIPFDSFTKKSIVQVIPTYLAKILNTLKGFEGIAGYQKQSEDNELMMDFNRGTWTTQGNALKEYNERKKYAMFSGTRAMDDEKRAIMSGLDFSSDEQREQFDKLVDNFFIRLSRQKGNIGSENFDIDSVLSDIDDSNAKSILRQWYKDTTATDSSGRKDTRKLSALARDAASVRSNIDTNLNDIANNDLFQSVLSQKLGGSEILEQENKIKNINAELKKLGYKNGINDSIDARDKSRVDKLVDQLRDEEKVLDNLRYSRNSGLIGSNAFNKSGLFEDVKIKTKDRGFFFDESENEEPPTNVSLTSDKLTTLEENSARLPNIGNILRHPLESFSNTLNVVSNKIGDFFFGKGEGEGSNGENAGGIFGVLQENINDKIFEPIQENILTPLKDSFNKYIFLPAKEFVKNSFDYVSSAISDNIISPVKNVVTSGFSSVMNNLTDAKDGLSARISSYFDSDETLGGKLLNWVKKNQKGLFQGGGVGIIGTLLTGNPILGLVAGASVSYVQSSEKAKKYLFGDADEPGKLTPLKNFFSKFGKGMLAGTLPGLLLGGPFGAVVGASAGYALQTDKVKKFLWGDEEKDGVLTKAKNWFKDHSKQFKGLGIGALAGLVAGGPLGAIVGASAGFALQTDTVKNYLFDKEKGIITKGWQNTKKLLFGDDKQKGLFTDFGKYMHQKWSELVDFGKNGVLNPMKRFWVNQVVNPLKGTFSPFLKEFQLKIKAMKDTIISGFKDGAKGSAKWVNEMFGKLYGKTISELMEKNIVAPVKKFFKEQIWQKLTGFIGGGIKSIVRRIRTKSDALRAKHLEAGIEYDDNTLNGHYDENGNFVLDRGSKKYDYDKQQKELRKKFLRDARARGMSNAEAKKYADKAIGESDKQQEATQKFLDSQATPADKAVMATDEKMNTVVENETKQVSLLDGIFGILKGIGGVIGAPITSLSALKGKKGSTTSSADTTATPTLAESTENTTEAVNNGAVRSPRGRSRQRASSTSSADTSGGGKFGSASPSEGAAAAVHIADKLDKTLPEGQSFGETLGSIFGSRSTLPYVKAIAKKLGCDVEGIEKGGAKKKSGSDFFSKLKNTILHPFESIKKTMSNAFNKVITPFKKIGDYGKKVIETIGDSVKEIAKGTWKVIESIGPAIWKGIQAVTEGLWEAGKAITKGLWSASKEIVPALWSASTEATKAVWAITKEAVPVLWKASKSIVEGLWSATKEVVPALFSATKELTKAVGRTLGFIWNGITGGVKRLFGFGGNESSSTTKIEPVPLPVILVDIKKKAENILRDVQPKYKIPEPTQKFAKGGVVKKQKGVPATGDNTIVGVNPGERVLTAEQNKAYEKSVKRERDARGRFVKKGSTTSSADTTATPTLAESTEKVTEAVQKEKAKPTPVTISEISNDVTKTFFPSLFKTWMTLKDKWEATKRIGKKVLRMMGLGALVNDDENKTKFSELISTAINKAREKARMLKDKVLYGREGKEGASKRLSLLEKLTGKADSPERQAMVDKYIADKKNLEAKGIGIGKGINQKITGRMSMKDARDACRAELGKEFDSLPIADKLDLIKMKQEGVKVSSLAFKASEKIKEKSISVAEKYVGWLNLDSEKRHAFKNASNADRRKMVLEGTANKFGLGKLYNRFTSSDEESGEKSGEKKSRFLSGMSKIGGKLNTGRLKIAGKASKLANSKGGQAVMGAVSKLGNSLMSGGISGVLDKIQEKILNAFSLVGGVIAGAFGVPPQIGKVIFGVLGGLLLPLAGPMLAKLGKTVLGFFSFMQPMFDVFKKVFGQIKDVAAKVGTAVLKGIFFPLILLGKVIMKLPDMFKTVYNYAMKFKKTAIVLANIFGGPLIAAITGVVVYWKEVKQIFNAVVKGLKAGFEPILTALKDVWTSFVTPFKTIFKAFSDAFKSIKESLFGKADEKKVKEGSGLAGVLKWTTRIVSFTVKTVLFPLTVTLKTIGLGIKVISGIVTGIVKPITWISTFIIKTVIGGIKTQWKIFTSPFKIIHGVFKSIIPSVENIKKVFNIIPETMMKIFNRAMMPFKLLAEAFGNIISKVKSGWNTMVGGGAKLVSKIPFVGGWLSKKFKKLSFGGGEPDMSTDLSKEGKSDESAVSKAMKTSKKVLSNASDKAVGMAKSGYNTLVNTKNKAKAGLMRFAKAGLGGLATLGKKGLAGLGIAKDVAKEGMKELAETGAEGLSNAKEFIKSAELSPIAKTAVNSIPAVRIAKRVFSKVKRPPLTGVAKDVLLDTSSRVSRKAYGNKFNIKKNSPEVNGIIDNRTEDAIDIKTKGATNEQLAQMIADGKVIISLLSRISNNTENLNELPNLVRQQANNAPQNAQVQNNQTASNPPSVNNNFFTAGNNENGRLKPESNYVPIPENAFMIARGL